MFFLSFLGLALHEKGSVNEIVFSNKAIPRWMWRLRNIVWMVVYVGGG